MKPLTTILAGACLVLLAAPFASPAADEAADLARGRYLVTVGGCNDCHTSQYAERGGQVPESEWLTGVPIGFNGPWGTSYPANLRLTVNQMDEQQFMARARSQLMPPMPWFNLVAMSDDDLASIYQYIASLGPAGETMPAYVPPGDKPRTPFIVFVPTTAVPERHAD